MFFDRRLPRPASPALFPLLEKLGAKAAELALTPDAGIWEYRTRARVHTYSAAMCWAGCNRVAAIARHLNLADKAARWSAIAERLHRTILDEAWNGKANAITAAFGSEDLDASVLLLPDLGLIDARDPRFTATVDSIEKNLMRGNHVLRYSAADDFGVPETAFLVCRFWLADARWRQGREDEARELFVDALRYRNHFGLLSEDVHPASGTLWGNFPQTYSLAGLILTAQRLSKSWEESYWHGSS
jgi:GH15 family glucan-1,4-alpha-glucosidase